MDRYTPDSIIAAVLQTPITVPVFLRYRMACPGCPMAPFDTLRDAAAEYHLPLDRLLAELNQTIAQEYQKGSY